MLDQINLPDVILVLLLLTYFTPFSSVSMLAGFGLIFFNQSKDSD